MEAVSWGRPSKVRERQSYEEYLNIAESASKENYITILLRPMVGVRCQLLTHSGILKTLLGIPKSKHTFSY